VSVVGACGSSAPAHTSVDDGRENPLRRWFDELTRGVGERPIPVERPEGSCGILHVGWNEHVLPILVSYAGVFVAASTLGEGRIVVFSGQDFLSSDPKSTFLGIEGNDALVRNAVRWASPLEADRPRVLVDNRAVADLLVDAGCNDVRVASILERGSEPPIEMRDWTASALDGIDVAVVLVNEWDCTHVRASEIASLRAFVERGGGLLIAGSNFHYAWAREDRDFRGNDIVAGSGLSFGDDDEPDLASARVAFDPPSSPVALWQAYLAGESLGASDMVRVPDAFASVARLGRLDEVERALRRLLAETPELPVAADDPEARLSAAVAMSLGPFPWPAVHPWAAAFPGVPAPGAERTESVVDVETSWTGARPLGLYAPPGELVTLRFADERVGDGLRIFVGDEYDDLRLCRNHREWRRAPALLRVFEVDAPVVPVSNPYGGPLYLIVPDAEGALPPGETVTVTVQGAIPMAVYTLGESRMSDWKRDLGRGAPHAILQARGSMRFVMPTSAAAKVDDPDRMLEFWSGFHASHAELAQEPSPRRFESHVIFDPQIGHGSANATSLVSSSMNADGRGIGRIALPLRCVESVLTLEAGEDDSYYWLIGHELGHQFQTDDWRGGDLDEIAVNLFPLYTENFYIHGGGEFETVGFEDEDYAHLDLRDLRWPDEELYRQLVLCFGWTALRRTFASYYDPAYPREEYGGHLDGFAIRFSAIVERDLTGFFEHWQYPLSEGAASKIRSFGFECWMPPGWPASGEVGR
jgi:hypothetical protein